MRWTVRAGHGPVHAARTSKAVAFAARNDLGLNVELEQSNARITWNPNSSAVAQAGAGTLIVRDGQSTGETSLNSSELHQGSLLYGPLTNSAMTFELHVGAITETFSVTLFDRHPSEERSAPNDSASAKLAPGPARSTDKPHRAEPRLFTAPRPATAETTRAPSNLLPPPPDLGAAASASHAGLPAEPLSTNIVVVPAPPPAPEAQVESRPSEQIEYLAPSPIKPVRPAVSANMLRLVSSPLTIRVRVHIDAQGKVVRAESLSRGSTLIDYFSNLSTSAAREWQFRPAYRGKQPVDSETILQFDFGSRGSVEGSPNN